MKKESRRLSLVLCVIGLLFASTSPASLVWHWNFQEPVVNASPDETLTLWATLYNDPVSTYPIYGRDFRDKGYWVGGYACCSQGLLERYELINPGAGGDVGESPNFFDQFTDLALLPGESLDFVYLVLKPKQGVLTAGEIEFRSRLNLRWRNTSDLFERYSDQDTRIVISAVPAPPAIGLFVSGLVTLFGVIRRRG